MAESTKTLQCTKVSSCPTGTLLEDMSLSQWLYPKNKPHLERCSIEDIHGGNVS